MPKILNKTPHRIALLLTLGLAATYATYVWAKTEDPTSLVQPKSLYGTYNGTLVPIKVTSDGSLAIQ